MPFKWKNIIVNGEVFFDAKSVYDKFKAASLELDNFWSTFRCVGDSVELRIERDAGGICHKFCYFVETNFPPQKTFHLHNITNIRGENRHIIDMYRRIHFFVGLIVFSNGMIHAIEISTYDDIKVDGILSEHVSKIMRQLFQLE